MDGFAGQNVFSLFDRDPDERNSEKHEAIVTTQH